jgi:hypothetical protein
MPTLCSLQPAHLISPDTEKLDGVSVPEPVLNDVVRPFRVFVTRDVAKAMQSPPWRPGSARRYFSAKQ